MTDHAAAAFEPAIEPYERLIIALDLSSADDARALADELRGRVGAFKIGLQLFTAAGPQFVRELVSRGHKVFLDLKFHDIPNTVAMAAVEAARLGVWMFNVHASGGREMMVRTRDELHDVCERESLTVPKVIGVTVLTSSDQSTLDETGIAADPASQALALAKLTQLAGLDGVVASAHEAARIRTEMTGSPFMIVTPGIRSISATYDDQKRVMSFGEALAAGADYVVVGRPVTQADDKLRALELLMGER